MALRFKNFIFDVDGTLVDSCEGVLYALEAALLSIGIHPDRVRLRELAFGPPLDQILASLIPDAEGRLRASLAFRRVYDTTGISLSRVLPGVNNLLRRIRGASGAVSFFSANNNLVVSRLLQMHGLLDPHDLVMTSDSFGQPLSKTELLRKLIENLVEPSKLVVIGDTEVDFNAAKNLGLDFVGAGYGYRGSEFLKDIGANQVAESPAHLAAFFFEMDKV